MTSLWKTAQGDPIEIGGWFVARNGTLGVVIDIIESNPMPVAVQFEDNDGTIVFLSADGRATQMATHAYDLIRSAEESPQAVVVPPQLFELYKELTVKRNRLSKERQVINVEYEGTKDALDRTHDTILALLKLPTGAADRTVE